jgi:hypothetical protein
MWMQGKGLGTCARQLVQEVATIKSMDVVLPVRTQQGTTDLRLRVVSKPDRMYPVKGSPPGERGPGVVNAGP